MFNLFLESQLNSYLKSKISFTNMQGNFLIVKLKSNLSILIFLLLSFSVLGQYNKCNLISDYYPTIYKAELNYLKGNYDLAFKFFKEAESNCELLNQPDILESVKYAELLGKRGDYKKCFYYLKKVLKKGFKYEFLENNSKLKFLQTHKKWIKLKANSTKYQRQFNQNVNQELRKKILELVKNDQQIRAKDDRSDEENSQLRYGDSLNLVKIKEIFKTYGYPKPSLIGHSYNGENTDIRFMLMHYRDTAYLKPKLLQYVKQGDCSPYVLGFFIDSFDRIKGEGYTYGVYNNVDSTDIKDFSSIDNTRKAIGLRSYSLEKERNDVIMALIRKSNKSKINN